jgi:uncharacterized protein YqeY
MKKLTAKKLDAHISSTYAIVAKGKMINMMDIGKVLKAARDAYDATSDTNSVDAAIAAKVELLCVVAA